jgi:hypothetical protein
VIRRGFLTPVDVPLAGVTPPPVALDLVVSWVNVNHPALARDAADAATLRLPPAWVGQAVTSEPVPPGLYAWAVADDDDDAIDTGDRAQPPLVRVRPTGLAPGLRGHPATWTLRLEAA